MDYTVANTHLKLNQMCDKMGSDYFPLPLILNFFETATYDLIGAHLKRVEITQTISDDISNLIVTTPLPVIASPSGSLTPYMAAIPENYLRQVAYDVFYENNERCRRADLKRHSEYVTSLTNTNKKPTKLYPAIVQQSGLFMIDAGQTVPVMFKLTYAKKPTFATTGEPNTRIVNLPDDTIEQIMKTTVTNLFNKTADERGQSSYQLEEAFRKTFR